MYVFRYRKSTAARQRWSQFGLGQKTKDIEATH